MGEMFGLPPELAGSTIAFMHLPTHFPPPTWVTLADGTGRFLLEQMNNMQIRFPKNGRLMKTRESFIIIHSISLLRAEERSVVTPLPQTREEGPDKKGSGFLVSLERATLSKKNKGIKL